MNQAPTFQRPPTVLLVEDSVESRQALRELLEEMDLTIVGEAADGSKGIELAESLRPDVVLMDVRMPGIDGLEATAVIRERLPATRVIVLTTFDDESLRRRAHEAGAAAYLLKEGPPQLISDAIFRVVRFMTNDQ